MSSKNKIITKEIVILFSCLFFIIPQTEAAEKNIYLRGGVGTSFSRSSNFSDEDCNSKSPAGFFGCVNGNDGKPIGAEGDFGYSVLFDIALGYKVNNWLSTELSMAYRPGFEFHGSSNFLGIPRTFNQDVTGDVDNFSAMFMGLIRPLALLGGPEWDIVPVVTGGVGIAYNKIDNMKYIFPKTETLTPDGVHTCFAWSVGAGFIWSVAQNMEFSLIYRYIDLGEVHTDVDTMTVSLRETGEVLNDSIAIDTTLAKLRVNELLLGLSWYF